MHSATRQPVQKGPDGVAADLTLLSSTVQTQQQDENQSPTPESTSDSTPAQAPLMHFPHCRLEITPIPSTTPNGDGASANSTLGKIEQIALPGALVRTLLARFEESQTPPPPSPQRQPSQPSASREGEGTKAQQQVQIQRHFDDADDWVYTRCLLADFTGFREDEAEALSAQGRLCCWASVVLRPLGDAEADTDPDAEGGKWELEFVVQRVAVRDPGSGWCECF